MRKNDAFVAKIVNTRLTKIFMAIFAPDERLPGSATLYSDNYDYDIVGGDNHHNLFRMLQTEFQAVLLEMSRICGVQVDLIIIVMQMF